MMKRSRSLPFLFAGGFRACRRAKGAPSCLAPCLPRPSLSRFFAGRKDAPLPRCTRGISPHTHTPPRHSGCTIQRAHSRGICGRRVEYVPEYVRRPGIPVGRGEGVFSARSVATSLGVRLREDDISPLDLPSLTRGRSPVLHRRRVAFATRLQH